MVSLPNRVKKLVECFHVESALFVRKLIQISDCTYSGFLQSIQVNNDILSR